MAFSHVWSLCIEEQFYLVLPFIAVFVFYRKSYRLAWSLLGLLLLGGVGLRAHIWMVYTNGMAHNPDLFNYKNYYTYIYYFTFCRLDPILCGVILAALRNFYSHFWHKITAKGNLTLLVGVVILCVTCYLFMHDGYVDRYSFLATVLGFPLLGLSFALLVTSSLSPNSILYRVKIWGLKGWLH